MQEADIVDKDSVVKLQKADLFINVIVPVFGAMVIYFFADKYSFRGYMRNQLPDSLWAWSLFSCLLIIWQRSIHTFWIVIGFAFCIAFELLQYFHIINGVGDFLDVLAYTLSGMLTLLFNGYFLIHFKYKIDENN